MRRWAIVAVLGVGACHEPRGRAIPPPPVAVTIARPVTAPDAAAPPPTPAEPPASTDPLALRGEPVTLGFLRDGTLVLASDRDLLAHSPGGAPRHRRLAEGEVVMLDPSNAQGDGLVIMGRTTFTLLDGALKELFHGEATQLMMAGGALAVTKPAPAVLLGASGALVRLVLPPSTVPITPEGLSVAPSGKFAVVTWTLDRPGDLQRDAGIYALPGGQYLGPGAPMSMMALAPGASFHGDAVYAVVAGEVRVIDLATAKITRRGKLPCPKGEIAGNPMVSPDGARLLITCGADGLALDPATFVVRRRYPRILPGCDNGNILPAHFERARPSVLVVEGCGGIARLDVATGVYACGDSPGVLGAPYEIGPGGGGPVLPADRRAVPHCTPGDGGMASLGDGYHYGTTDTGETFVIGAAGRLSLGNQPSIPSISADAKRLVYATGDRVVVRGLPDGKELQSYRILK